MGEDIYRSETLLVRCTPAEDTTRWIVTFDHYGSNAHFDRPGFAEEFLISEGVSQISILGSGNHWYQYPDIGLALEAARTRLSGAERIMTYGSSMGAYAAIRFAAPLGAQCCLALSPQYSNDPARVPFEWRWQNDAAAIAWMPEVDGPIKPGVRTVVIADARREDAEHVRRIAADIPIETVSLAYTAHPVTTYLNAARLLRSAVRDMIDDRFDVAAFRREALARRRQSEVYLSELARLQPAHRPRTGIALARKAVAQATGNPLVHHILGLKLEKAGQRREGLECLKRAVDMSDAHWGYALPYSEALARAGEHEAAFAVADDLVTRVPDSAALHCWVANLHWMHHRPDEARHHAGLACTLAPTNEFYAANRATYANAQRPGPLRSLRWMVQRCRAKIAKLIRPRRAIDQGRPAV